jgi:ribonuclease HI
MAKIKFYAVVQGRKPGIYTEWFGALGAEVQIKGFAGAVYKSFPARAEAEAWLRKQGAETPAAQQRMQFPSAEEKGAHEKATRRSKRAIDSTSEPRAAESEERVVIYTDGGCSKNPGPGGYGVVLLVNGQRRELSGGFAHTTNNRMELMGCIKALESFVGPCPVSVHSDSQYVVNGISKGWAKRWRGNNWMRNRDEAAENSDLWALLLELCEKHDVQFHWVRGHNGHPENERCDVLAVEMTHRSGLPPDKGYKKK